MNHSIKIWLSTFILATAAASILLFFGVSLPNLLIYLVVFLGYVTFPGIVLFRLFIFEDGYGIRTWIFGTVFGLIFLTVVFIFLRTMNCFYLFSIYPLFLTPLFLIKKNSRHVLSEPLVPEHVVILNLASIFVLFLVFLKYFALNPLPGSMDAIRYFHDYPWHMAVVAEAMHHWPLQDPQLAFHPLVNHSFGHMTVAGLALASHLELPVVVFRLFHPLLVFLLIYQIYLIGKYFLESGVIGLGAVALVFFAGEPVPFKGHLFTYIMHEKWTDFSFLLGMNYMALWLFMVFRVIEKGVFEKRQGIPFFLISAVMAGTKTPLVPMLIAALIPLLLIKRIRASALKIFLCTSLGFSFSMACLFYSFEGRVLGGWFSFSPFLHEQLSNFWKGTESVVPYFFGKQLILWGLCFLGAGGLRLWGTFILMNIKFRNLNPFYVILLGISFSGLLAGSMIRGRSGEELYFIHFSNLALALTAAAGFYYFKEKLKIAARNFFFYGALILGIGTLLELGLNFASAFSRVYTREMFPSDAVLTQPMYEALQWLKKSTDKDAVIASLPQSGHDFLVPAFAERRMLIGGWSYQPEIRTGRSEIHEEILGDLSRMLSGAIPFKIRELGKKYQIQFVLWDKVKWPESPQEESGAEIVFQNSQAVIYQIT